MQCIFLVLVSSAVFIISSTKYSFMNTIRVSNSLDSDQNPFSVLVQSPNCLQRLLGDNKVAADKEIINLPGIDSTFQMELYCLNMVYFCLIIFAEEIAQFSYKVFFNARQ